MYKLSRLHNFVGVLESLYQRTFSVTRKFMPAKSNFHTTTYRNNDKKSPRMAENKKISPKFIPAKLKTGAIRESLYSSESC